MKKILLLTDFSAASRHAVHYVQALFDDVAAEFCLFYAYPILPDVLYDASFLLTTEQREAESQLAGLLAELTQAGVPAHHTYRAMAFPGGPVGAVEALLRRERFDFVGLGATGLGKREWLGSVATGVVRQVKTSVLVVPTNAPIRPLRRIVLATDYAALGRTNFLRPLKRLTAWKGAELTLLTVENPQTGTGSPDRTLNQNGRRRLLRYFATVQTGAYVIRDEDVRRGIDTYLDTHAVDLLVAVPHHTGWLDQWWGHSLTRTLAYHPRVPLLTLYQPADAPVKTRHVKTRLRTDSVES